jgi:3,8-divinyl chlorophyllide a/chlorophyllide a reductase subunit X
MSTSTNATDVATAPIKFIQAERLRAEAAIEPDPVATGPVTKETQIIAIYGKGGIGKSFTLANLSYMMAQQGKKVLLIGCDPKSDTTSLLFGGKACPTIIETSSKKKLSGEAVSIGDVCFKRDGVFAMELGGPEVGRGCGGRGIIHGNWVFTTGALITCCWIFWATWYAAALVCRSPATCARR